MKPIANAGAVLLIVVAAFSAGACKQTDADRPLTIFAAASLTDALPRAAEKLSAKGFADPRINFTGSNILRMQIAGGATADLFLPASPEEIDVLAPARAPVERITLARNRIAFAVVASGDCPVTVTEAISALAGRRLALADPDTVPAGIYAKRALQAAGVWGALKPLVAPAVDVRAAAALVASGAAPAGIVYATDVAADGRIKECAGILTGPTRAVEYQIAVLSGTREAAAAAYARALASPELLPVWESFGFSAP